MKKDAQDKRIKAQVYSSHEPNLRQNMPESLAKIRGLRYIFDHERCPLISKQLKGRNKTEAQSRRDSGGSKMVKLHKPFPELRPKHDISQIKRSFNQQWLREARDAQMKRFDEQARAITAEKSNDHNHNRQKPSRGLER